MGSEPIAGREFVSRREELRAKSGALEIGGPLIPVVAALRCFNDTAVMPG